MDIIQAIILGIVQGASEFIPISSSGHLVIVPWLLGWEHPSLLFDTMLHWGTLLSIVLVFWRDLWAIFWATLRSLATRSMADANARLGWYIVVGSIPVMVTSLLFKDPLEALFASPLAAGCFLLITAGLLAASEMAARRLAQYHGLDTMRWRHAIWIGLAQAIALAPGISRSGSTMAAGLALGVRRADAARFSFLLGTPAFLGAGLLQLADALAVDVASVVAQLPMMLVGFLSSAVVGYIAIRGLIAYLRRRSLYLFAGYCLMVGLAVIALSLLAG